MYFEKYKDIFKQLYLENNEDYLSQVNFKFITTICKILKITTKIRKSSEFNLVDGKTERLLKICKDCNANIYLSGPSARNYFDENMAKKEKIKVEWMDYSGYREYRQCFKGFEHGVTILDLIFNEGDSATKFMKSFK